MKILTINVGSSSVKYALFENKKRITKGLVERIGISKIKTHEQALKIILKNLTKHISSLKEIKAVAHRIVHGGKYKSSVVITPTVIEKLKNLQSLAPLHEPFEIKGVLLCKKLVGAKQIAVFDTSFFTTLPEKAKIYALPNKLNKKYNIKRYGFHGTSHNYVAQEAAKLLKKRLNKLKLITCHLGNGCSITATKYGKAIDTSMGFTPLEGLVMGSRSGDIDPGIITFIAKKEKLSLTQVENLLNKKSGLKGLCNFRDMRDILKSRNKLAKLAFEIFCYRAAKYIGAYITSLNGADAIVFTAGIGENAPKVRERIISYFTYLNIKINKAKNNKNAKIISSSKTKVLVIPTDEELMMAKETLRLIR